MSDAINNYRNMVDRPWGKMFYEQIYIQLDIPEDKRIKILDFGAGFCLTTDHYAKYHDVTALEPNKDMSDLRVQTNDYTLIPQGIDYLSKVGDNTYDAVFCHNVLEYAQNREDILKQLVRVLKHGGILSVVKHNLPGRAMAYAVFGDDPKGALALLDHESAENSAFGSRDVYSSKELADTLASVAIVKKTFGIRTFFGLSANNEIKYTKEWYDSMLELETRASMMEEYKNVAFFNHLIFEKI